MTYPPDYNEFWRLWPGRWQPKTDKYKKVGKDLAYKQWVKVSKTDQKFIVDKLLKTSRLKADGTQFLPDAHRWLRDKMWEDYR